MKISPSFNKIKMLTISIGKNLILKKNEAFNPTENNLSKEIK